MRTSVFIAAVLGLTSSVQADFALVDLKSGIILRPDGQPTKFDDAVVFTPAAESDDRSCVDRSSWTAPVLSSS
jgi:hypothetical protein